MNILDKNNNTPEAKGVRTFIQSVVATVIAFFYGLWQLPGVSEYTSDFVQTQGFSFLIGAAALVGIPAGIFAYLHNRE
jgi:hypothetical protein